MSADRAGTLGLTPADIAQALADTPLDDPATPESTTTWSWNEPDTRPAAWAAFGEDK